jgi:hypothetical protein
MQPPGGTKFLHFSLKKFPRELFLKFEKTFQKGDGVFGAFPDDDFHRHTPVLVDSYTGYAGVRGCVRHSCSLSQMLTRDWIASAVDSAVAFPER